MLENLVSVGPPMPSTQAAQSSRDSKQRDLKSEKFENALKDANSKKDAAEAKADRSTLLKEKELREPTEAKSVGIRQTKTKAKKGGKEEAEEEISKFMDSLQSEIGISPARLAEVLQKNEFPPEVAKNEDAMETLTKSLDLDNDSSSKLQQMLLGLEQRLKDLNPMSVKGLLKTEVQALVKDNQTLPVMKLIEGQASLRAQREEQGDPASLLGTNSLASRLNGIESSQNGLDPRLMQLESQLQPQSLGASQKLAMAGAASATALAIEKENLLQKISDLNERFWMKDPSAAGDANQAVPSMLPSGLEDRVRAMMADNANSSSLQVPQNQWSGSSKLPMENMNMGEQSMGSNSFGGGEGASFKEKSLKETSDSLQGLGRIDLQSLSLPPLTPNHAVGGGAGLGAISMLSMQDRQENIQNILNGAQILVKEGGGEMKVQMSPEGMGPVELKVSMQDGRLKVEMLTESQEAKKIIESQLTDLKMGLAGHKLAVDSLKVDVVQKLNTESNTQNFTNMNQQQQQQSQDQLRQMWSQFSDQLGSQRRNSYFDVGGPKDNLGKKEALNPVSTNTKAQPRQVVGKGEGLNLVA